MFGFIVTIYSGLEHAFEADHLLAVNNLVTNRDKISQAMKDGVYWGIGHTATIFLVGVLMILLKYEISDQTFSYLEATVGIMLVFLGFYRLFRLIVSLKSGNDIVHTHLNADNKHLAALGVGMVHGLAGSGALVVLVLTQMKSAVEGLFYILIFGIGSVIGMFLASGLFSIPFSRNVLRSKSVQIILIMLSSLLCVGYGAWVVYTNLSGK